VLRVVRPDPFVAPRPVPARRSDRLQPRLGSG